MTLGDLEHQNKGRIGFFRDLRLRYTFQEQIALESLYQNKMRINFLVLNADYNSLSLEPQLHGSLRTRGTDAVARHVSFAQFVLSCCSGGDADAGNDRGRERRRYFRGSVRVATEPKMPQAEARTASAAAHQCNAKP